MEIEAVVQVLSMVDDVGIIGVLLYAWLAERAERRELTHDLRERVDDLGNRSSSRE